MAVFDPSSSGSCQSMPVISRAWSTSWLVVLPAATSPICTWAGPADIEHWAEISNRYSLCCGDQSPKMCFGLYTFTMGFVAAELPFLLAAVKNTSILRKRKALWCHRNLKRATKRQAGLPSTVPTRSDPGCPRWTQCSTMGAGYS